MNTPISSNEQQAIDFLTATRTTFKVFYSHHSKHFADDKETRDIYKVKIMNGRGQWTITFGQSIVKSNYGNTPPTPYDVLACLTKCDPGTFEAFCSEFGYNSDSRKAEKIYKSVVAEWRNVERMFNPQQIEQLQDIQ